VTRFSENLLGKFCLLFVPLFLLLLLFLPPSLLFSFSLFLLPSLPLFSFLLIFAYASERNRILNTLKPWYNYHQKEGRGKLKEGKRGGEKNRIKKRRERKEG
jgi:hypothetical protein